MVLVLVVVGGGCGTCGNSGGGGAGGGQVLPLLVGDGFIILVVLTGRLRLNDAS